MSNEQKLRDYLRRVTSELDEVHDRLREARERASEPIAVVSMSCRLPGGADSPGRLWRLLVDGRDAMTALPADRGWDLAALARDPSEPGTCYATSGGFLDDVAGFDAEFFGVSPREALAMDPQQRLVLEGAWELLERAGLDPGDLSGTDVGVYLGTNGQDYGASAAAVPETEGYVLTGSIASVLSGRVAYALGLEGPALTVDTACSASLVALHLACTALREKECSMAMVGGVTAMASPHLLVEFSRQRGLSPDGRCRPFADGADGTAFSEGMGMVLLERLSDAQRLGHDVLAVVRGSAVNQDGASNGLTAPNGPSQQRVIRQALSRAGLCEADIDVVEAHGTGTALGDPIEAQALLATYGSDRDAGRPLWLGSIKSNIGHTQAAAGVAGVLKMVLALQHEELPQTLYVDRPTTRVDWSAGRIRLLQEPQLWPAAEGRVRRAAVSSFGISGTNAHVILEQAPPSNPSAVPVRPAAPSTLSWSLSARSTDALREQAARLRSAVGDEHPVDVGWSLAARTGFRHRAVVLGADRDALLAGLDAVAAQSTSPSAIIGEAVLPATRPVFVFPGQGAQWVGMGVELAAQHPAFADRLDECADALCRLVDWDLREVLRGAPVAPSLDRVDVVQPASWAVMVSLAAAWRSLGVQPGAVVGHSQGEIAAACVAGMLTLEDAARIVVLRSRAIAEDLAGRGGMVSVALPVQQVRQRIEPLAGVSVAAINGASATVVSGDPAVLDELVSRWTSDGVRAKRIPVDYASHSSQVESVRDRVLTDLADLAPRDGAVPMISTVRGEFVRGRDLDARYWFENLRLPVGFADAVTLARDAGNALFIEVGPHPVLVPAMQEQGVDAAPVRTIGTLRRDDGGLSRFLASAAEAHVAGADVDWRVVQPGGRPVDLPTYPFQRTRFWAEPPVRGGSGTGDSGLHGGDHPLLAATSELPEYGGFLLSGRIGLHRQPWLDDHRVLGAAILPGTALVEMAVLAGDHVGCAVLEELVLSAPLVLPDDGEVRVQVVVAASDDSGRRTVTVHGSCGNDAGWTRHASGVLAAHRGPIEFGGPADLEEWPPTGSEPVDRPFYERAAAAGYEYGPSFQGLRAVWTRGAETFAEVELPEALHGEADHFTLHPALLDAALQPLIAQALPEIEQGTGPHRLPFSWSGVSLHATGARQLRVRVAPTEGGGVEVTAVDAAGGLVARVDDLRLRPLPATGPGTAAGHAVDMFEIGWAPLEIAAAPGPGTWAVLGEPHERLEAALADGGVGVVRHPAADALSADDDTLAVVVHPVPEARGTDARTARLRCAEVLATMQSWLAVDRPAGALLVVVTLGAVATSNGDDAIDPAAAAVWGLGRTAQTEHPDRIVLADVDGHRESWTALAAAVGSGDPQVALRRGEAFVPRLRPTSDRVLSPPSGPAWRLEPGQGAIEGLHLAPHPPAEAPPGPGQVRIAVRAAGLNFRDVVLALGMVADTGELGSEVAGVVTDVGQGVVGLAPGDRVAGLAFGAFGPVCLADARTVVRVPQEWSFARAASVPVVFVTAYYALVDLAGLRAGESVLVHAAAGGVGMAAVQLARHLGAEVFGTASSAKWPAVQALGIDGTHLFSSRDGRFEREILDRTDGRGVDVVLDSLAGDLVDASLRTVARGGRFVEMGKTDVRDPDAVEREHPGVAYRAFDLREAMPERIGEMLREVVFLLERGVLTELPLRTWDIRRAPEAFRHLAAARHVGKVALTLPRRLDPDGTVLVTGATGTLGRLVTEHLVREHGVRHLVLLSRSGPAAPGAAELDTLLSGLGAEVEIESCDVADRAALAAILDRVRADRPLTGVVHTAGVLDDGTLLAQDADRWGTVFDPKASAAQHLDELTAADDLALFSLFSSAAATIGSAGQANYAAANAFLDALAHNRASSGRPGVSMAWGLWAESSGLTGDLGTADLARLRRWGTSALPTGRALELFDAAASGPPGHLVLLPVNADGLARTQTPTLLQGLVGGVGRRRAATAGPAADPGWADRLSRMPVDERTAAVRNLVRAHAATVLGHSDPAAVPEDRGFLELGFDSLTAVELRNHLASVLGTALPTTLAFDHPSPVALADYLVSEVLDGAAAAPSVPDLEAVDRIAAALPAIATDRAARAALAQRLRGLLAEVEETGAGDSDSGLDRIESASDEEIFDLIDEEFGVS